MNPIIKILYIHFLTEYGYSRELTITNFYDKMERVWGDVKYPYESILDVAKEAERFYQKYKITDIIKPISRKSTNI